MDTEISDLIAEYEKQMVGLNKVREDKKKFANDKEKLDWFNRVEQRIMNSIESIKDRIVLCEYKAEMQYPFYKGDQDERDNEEIILEKTVDISRITEDNNLNEYHEKRDREEKFSTQLLEMFLQWVTLMVAISSLAQIIKEII